MTLHVVVCIVGYRNADDIHRCVAALARSTHQAFEILVCENGGADAETALAELLPPRLPGGQAVAVIGAPDNPGYAGGVNRCLAARPDAGAWWVLNPDSAPEPDAMAHLQARIAAGSADAVGGTIYLPDGRVQGHGGRWRPWLARAESIGHGSPATLPVDAEAVEAQMNYILGASLMLGRRFLERAGPMREDYFLYGEEVEWCLRARARGLRLGFEPAARIRHDQGTTTGSGDAVTRRPRIPIYLDERNKMLIVRDTLPARLPVAATAALVLTALRFARRGAWVQWRHALAGWLAGLRAERGKPGWLLAAQQQLPRDPG